MKFYINRMEPHSHSHHNEEENVDGESHDHRHQHGDREHDDGKAKPQIPYQFKMQVFEGFITKSQYLPNPIFDIGFEGGMLLGVKQGKKHFLLGPAFQWSRGETQRYDIKTQTRNFFLGLELQFGRSIKKKWNISLSSIFGLRSLNGSNMILDQGIVVNVKDKAFELQGKVQTAIKINKVIGFFSQLHLGQAFYLISHEAIPLGGFHLGLGLGFVFDIK